MNPVHIRHRISLFLLACFIIIVLKSCKWYPVIPIFPFRGKHLSRYLPIFYLRLKETPFPTCCVLSEHRKTDKDHKLSNTDCKFFFFDGTARDGPWPPLQYASKPLDPLLCPSIRLFSSFSGPWTRHPAISFLVFLFVLLHTAFCTSFSELRCLAFFLYDQAIVFFGIL